MAFFLCCVCYDPIIRQLFASGPLLAIPFLASLLPDYRLRRTTAAYPLNILHMRLS